MTGMTDANDGVPLEKNNVASKNLCRACQLMVSRRNKTTYLENCAQLDDNKPFLLIERVFAKGEVAVIADGVDGALVLVGK
jgi:hypothetical protein